MLGTSSMVVMLFNLNSITTEGGFIRRQNQAALEFQSTASARGWSGKVLVPGVKPRFAPSARILHISWKGAVAGGAQDVLCECAWP